MATMTAQKTLGAYYTDEVVADYLVKWAIRRPSDSVLDPSCGDGVFLAAATHRLRKLGARQATPWGIDIDDQALRAVTNRLSGARLLNKNFFVIKPSDVQSFDVVVGNPPFIRYQVFNGDKRGAALERAREAGAVLPHLSSSWAPFVVHAVEFLKPKGRLAMVVPAELGHAAYAGAVLRFLVRKFGRINVVMFRRKLFPDLSQDTMLLLCEEHGEPCHWFGVLPTESIEGVANPDAAGLPVNIEAIRSGKLRLKHYLVTKRARSLYEGLREQAGVSRLGAVANVGIGYVTGCNDYFHLTEAEVQKWEIPRKYLRPAVLSLGSFQGALLRRRDWEGLVTSGGKAYLVLVPSIPEKDLPRPLKDYLQHGKKLGAQLRYKTKVREHWYSVPHVATGNALLSYMSGKTPKLVANRAGVVAPNTLHVVTFTKQPDAKSFTAGWYSSLTRLSCELEGHALGGGMLKLEPTEAEQVLVGVARSSDLTELLVGLDEDLRAGAEQRAMARADTCILRRRLGLSATECSSLQEAASFMLAWRLHR